MTEKEWKQAYEEGAPVTHCTRNSIWVPAHPKVDTQPPPLLYRPIVSVRPIEGWSNAYDEPYTFYLEELRRLTPEEIVLHGIEL